MCDKAYETAIDIVITIVLSLLATIYMVASLIKKSCSFKKTVNMVGTTNKKEEEK